MPAVYHGPSPAIKAGPRGAPRFDRDPTRVSSAVVGPLRSLHAVGVHEQRIQRRRCGNEQSVSLRATEGEVGYRLRNPDLPEHLAVRLVHADPGARAGPQVAVAVEAESVVNARVTLGEDTAVRER